MFLVGRRPSGILANVGLIESSKGRRRLAPTLMLAAVTLLASWMANTNGGYFVKDWALLVFLLAALMMVASLMGFFRAPRSRWVTAALGLFAGYAAWSLASLLWSPNEGDAWLGAGQTLAYLLAFGTAVALLGRGASRRWMLAASVLGPAVVASFTLATLVPRAEDLFDDDRLSPLLGTLTGTLGYHNGEAAFLLTPFWVAVYLAGSWRVNPAVRGLALAGATVSVELAILTQSRGALFAMVISSLVFFVFSGQRLRGLLALVPIAGALLISFQSLNDVYLALLNGEDPAAALNEIRPNVWLAVTIAGLYGFFWGLVDERWRPPAVLTRVFGGAVLAIFVAVSVFGAVVFVGQVGNPIVWGAERWEAFKADDVAGQDQSRYLSSSGSGRYVLWQVAWQDFASHPLLGVGTHNYEATYYQMRERNVGFARQPHMLPLEVFSERGVVGGVLFFGFLGTCLAAGLWQRFKYLKAEGKALAGATIAALAYWFAHSSAEWFWQIPAVTLPAMIYLAMLVAPWNERGETAPARRPLRTAFASAAVLAVVVVAPLFISDRYLARSFATENPWAALEDVQSARMFNPVNPQPVQREAELRLQIGDWPRVEQAYDEAIELNPEHYAPYALLARFYEQRDAPEEALSSYREALTFNPLDEELEESTERLEGADSEDTG